MRLDQQTIKLLDDVSEGDIIEIEYDAESRTRMAIGRFYDLRKDETGEWCVYLKNRYVGVRVIDVVSIRDVKSGVR